MDWIISAFVLISLLNNFLNIYAHRSQRGAVGGVPTEFDEFPFMSALGWTKNATDEVDYLCGGLLISQNFVLTAAHCVLFESKPADVVKIGGNNLNSTSNEEHTVETYSIHPRYNNSYAYDDIAILKLTQNSTKRTALLWTDTNLNAMTAIAIGYGTTQLAGSRTPILQKVKLTIMKEADCAPYFKRKRKFPVGLASSHICAGDPNGKQDTCQGDSGGPLIVKQIFVAGIISSGLACGGVPPAIYTRIATNIDWITEILNENGYKRDDYIFDNHQEDCFIKD